MPHFQLATDPVDDGPDLAADECACEPADDQYLLTIDEGQAVIVHAACGKQPPSSWGDWHDLVTMNQPIPVTINWESNCSGSHYEGGCDCDFWVDVAATSVPEDVRTAALELSHKHAAARELARRLPGRSNALAAVYVLLAAKHTPTAYNPYGACVIPGFRIVEGLDRKARVEHLMPEADLSDPDRPSSDEMAAERHRQVDAYAATLTAAGWTVERRGPYDQRPWLLATPEVAR